MLSFLHPPYAVLRPMVVILGMAPTSHRITVVHTMRLLVPPGAAPGAARDQSHVVSLRSYPRAAHRTCRASVARGITA